MPTLHTVPGYVRLLNVTFNGTNGAAGSSLNWNTLNLSDVDTQISDDDSDGLLDVGVDDWLVPTIPAGTYLFTGYTINSGGEVYGIFSDGTFYYVPIDEEGVGQTTIPSSGTSNVFEAEIAAFLCMAEGTYVATPTGEQTVESLNIGDLITTADGRSVPVLWVGRQTFAPATVNVDRALVRITAGALGGGLPQRDLLVTGDHGMVLGGAVINASALVNGTSIQWEPAEKLPAKITVYHIETEAHDVILAEGAPTETFIDYIGRRAFDNFDEYLTLYGVERIVPEMAMPRITASEMLPQALRARLGFATDHGTRVA